jgi:hypothetical protein
MNAMPARKRLIISFLMLSFFASGFFMTIALIAKMGTVAATIESTNPLSGIYQGAGPKGGTIAILIFSGIGMFFLMLELWAAWKQYQLAKKQTHSD